jgi:predicted amidohydrolase
LVFPELALTGYLVDSRFTKAARHLDSPEIQELKNLSRAVDLTVGFIEETPTALFYNSALHLSRGRIVSLHRKIYPPTYGRFDERRYFGAGWDISAFDTPHGRMAMLICADAWHLPLPYMAAHDGADVLLILAASSQQGLSETTPCHDAWRWMCQSYSLTLSCFVVLANMAAGDEEYNFWGGSLIAGPDGNLLAQSQTNGPDLVWADVELQVLRRQRVQLPFRRDDSLVHTVQLGQRILRSKLRRDRFYGEQEPQDPVPVRPR